MKKIQISMASALTFSFLFSGNILYGLYYSSGNPVVSYIIISAVLLLYSCFATKYLSSRKSISHNGLSECIAVFAGIFMLIPLAYTIFVYAEKLGSFARYYSSVQVTVFAVLATVLSGICIAKKGTSAIAGFARMTLWLMPVWILAGCLGFIHTENVVIPLSPFKNFTRTEFLDIAKNAVLITADMVLLLVALSDNKEAKEKMRISSQVMKGVWAYIAVSGVNMLKNSLMFGNDFLTQLDNPDLAAIRLIPMFELPEISVIVDTFAVTLRTAVYLCALFFMVKDAFGKAYSTTKQLATSFVSVSAAALFFIYMKKNLPFAGIVAVASLLACVVMCMAFFGSRKKDESGDGI